ncbi:hypothetical protein [Novosphingobium sp. B1]|uniref:hypothetical protein n=1 Tax=Novosphingobium sp. B1 TaxID=1938756 RepID=UPI0009D8CD0E|nr:hypothetical protein [Novosphingobium sp. B1]SMC31064.1 hypothetical protein SAMN06272759_101300 [Novosphingobium sp. B1]
MDIMAMLSGTSTAITLAKAVKDAEVSLDVATIKAQMAEILSELSDAKLAQAALLEENAQLKAEVARLAAAGDEIGAMVDVGGYKYEPRDGTAIGWPACPACLANEKRVTILVQNGKAEDAKCPRCKSEFSPVVSFVAAGVTRKDEELRRRAEGMERLNRLAAPRVI